MGYERFRHMSDEDVYSLVAYMNTLAPVRNRVPRSKIDFPVSLMIKSAPRPAGHVLEPDRTNKLKYGEYLVTVAGCTRAGRSKSHLRLPHDPEARLSRGGFSPL
jgi:hypothetical protein